MAQFIEEEGLYRVRGPMCNWDMQLPSEVQNRLDEKYNHEGEDTSIPAYVRKMTGWLTNSWILAELLSGACSNLVGGRPWHRHAKLIGGTAKYARVYPPKLVAAILQAVRKEMEDRGLISEINTLVSGPVPDEYLLKDFENEELGVGYWDDVNGGWLKPDLMQAARKDELDYVKQRGIYRVVLLAQCLEKTGKYPIPLRWVDTNKGDDARPNYRARLGVKDIAERKKKKHEKKSKPEIMREMTFKVSSSMPPLECLKLLGSLLVTLKVSKHGKMPLKIRIIDIRKAHCYGKAEREIFIWLPEEEGQVDEWGRQLCGLLEMSLYGTQDASYIWEKEYGGTLKSDNYRQGVSNGALWTTGTKSLKTVE